MKKSKSAFIALCLLLSLLLTGCGLGPRMTRAALEMDKVGSFHMDMDLDLSIGMSVLGKTSELQMLVNEGMDVQKEPLVVYSETTTETMGVKDTVLAYYVQSADGGEILVSHDKGKSWEKQTLDSTQQSAGEGYTGLFDQLSLLTKLASSFEEVGTETVNGAPAIRYDGEIEGEFVTEALRNTGALSGLLEQFGVEGDGMDLTIEGTIPTSIWLDKATSRIVRYDMDLSEAIASVWDVLQQELMKDETFAALDKLGLALSVERAHLTAELSQYDAVGELTLPENAA